MALTQQTEGAPAVLMRAPVVELPSRRSRLGLQPSQLFLLLPPTRCRRLTRDVLAPLRRELRGVTADPPSLPPILSSPLECGSTLVLQRLLQLLSYQTAWVLAANCGAPCRGTSARCRRLRRLQCAQVSARRRDLGFQLFDEVPSVSYFGCNSRGSRPEEATSEL